MRARDLKSLHDVASSLQRRMPAADPGALIRAVFRLPEGALEAATRGDALYLWSTDKTARCALRGMESRILAYLAARGHANLRRIVWSAE
jgi:hypothetical protein